MCAGRSSAVASDSPTPTGASSTPSATRPVLPTQRQSSRSGSQSHLQPAIGVPPTPPGTSMVAAAATDPPVDGVGVGRYRPTRPRPPAALVSAGPAGGPLAGDGHRAVGGEAALAAAGAGHAR